MSESKKPTKKAGKKVYRGPELKKFGSVHDLTQTLSSGSKDGGATPNNGSMTMCASATPEIVEQRDLVADHVAQHAFQKAIAASVKPGDVVVDLGCGNGLHTLFALKAGAKKVYAIEAGTFIHSAREVIERNGYSDHVEFIHGYSKRVELPERADVLISNIGFMWSLKNLPDAASRFLKPNGKMIPSAAQIGLMPYMDEAFYRRTVGFWDEPHYGFDFRDLKKLATNHPHYQPLKQEGILAPASLSPKMEFANANLNKLSFECGQVASRSGIMHALGGFYRFLNGDDVLMSTEPPIRMSPEIWTNFLLPLDVPIEIKSGDRVTFQIEMDIHLLADSIFWTWAVRVNEKEKARQSSFEALNL